MGKKDTITKMYMSKPEYFADAFNYYLFDGNQTIQASDLCPVDPTELGIVFDDENKEIIQKVRDVLKQCIIMQDGRISYLLLGIENQSNIHYAMPVKNMIYDALNYGQQVSEITKLHREKKDVLGDEFLSGFSKADILKPVITLVIYFGVDTWDAPRSLKEMFGEVGEDILQFICDYKVNLLIPKEIKDFTKFKTDFGKAMKYISVSDDKNECKNIANKEQYRMINLETAQLLNECVGMEIIIKDREEKVDMCEAVKAIKLEGRLEGRLEGIDALITTLRELGHDESIVLEKIVEKFSVTEEEAKRYMAR